MSAPTRGVGGALRRPGTPGDKAITLRNVLSLSAPHGFPHRATEAASRPRPRIWKATFIKQRATTSLKLY